MWQYEQREWERDVVFLPLCFGREGLWRSAAGKHSRDSTLHIHFPPPLSERCLSLQKILPQLRWVGIAEDERIGFQRCRLQTGRDRCYRRRKEEQSKAETRRNASEEEFWNSCSADVLPVRSKPSRAERERESERRRKRQHAAPPRSWLTVWVKAPPERQPQSEEKRDIHLQRHRSR